MKGETGIASYLPIAFTARELGRKPTEEEPLIEAQSDEKNLEQCAHFLRVSFAECCCIEREDGTGRGAGNIRSRHKWERVGDPQKTRNISTIVLCQISICALVVAVRILPGQSGI